jgi:hypothetical protein
LLANSPRIYLHAYHRRVVFFCLPKCTRHSSSHSSHTRLRDQIAAFRTDPFLTCPLALTSFAPIV